jgi:protein SCO1
VRTRVLLVGTLLLVAVGGLAVYLESRPVVFHGTTYDPPMAAPHFILLDHNFNRVRLSDFRGHPVLLFFGYTNCPDVCPTTMAEFKRVKRDLGEAADQVAFVFISVDGERDTVERLAQYVTAFDPDFIGLTGDETLLRPIAQDYGVFFQRQDYDSAAGYLVDHTASSFVVDPDGRLAIVFPYGTEPAIIAQRVRTLLGA